MSAERLQEALSILADSCGDPLPELGKKQLTQMRRYLETLLLWRDRFALIATADPVLLVEHHIVDSLHVAAHLSGCNRLADIGSGAGLPGVPLAIALPKMQVCLIESRRKKASFLREARRSLGLDNVEIVEGRAEAITDPRFDALTSRALGPVKEFLQVATKLLRQGGTAIAMRGPQGSRDVVVHSEFALARTVSYRLALERERILLIYRRV